MTQNISDAMYSIASHVNDLNTAGKVKAQTSNEKGYAKIFSINSGCRVWVHHTLDNKLILDLMVTKNAALKYPEIAKSAIATFSKFAKDEGHTICHRPWQHSINKADIRQQYLIEVTHENSASIVALIDKVRLAF